MSKINTDFWVKNSGKSFTSFFNTFNGGKGHWGVDLNGNHVPTKIVNNGDTLLTKIFSNENIQILTGNDDVNIFQFIIMVSIMINETGGKLNTTVTEFGSLEYMFNKKGKKASYNRLKGNKTAYDLFRDINFMSVPSRLSMIKPKNINDPAWKGMKYPSNELVGGYNSKDNYKVGLISECDFYKFRGRGLIQLTGRANYIDWMKQIKANKNSIPFTRDTSLPIINSWGANMDIAATKITNAELDTLFSDTILSYYTLKVHYSIKTLKKMYAVQNPDQFISLAYTYGKQINGGDTYATHFTNRVFEILEKLPNFIE